MMVRRPGGLTPAQRRQLLASIEVREVIKSKPWPELGPSRAPAEPGQALDINIWCGRLTEAGVEFLPLNDSDWERAGACLLKLERATAWAWGDWFNAAPST